MVSTNHLACLADGLYQILTLVPEHFLSTEEKDKLVSKLAKNKEFSPNTIYKKLYKLNKKAMIKRYGEILSDDKITRPDDIPEEYDKYIKIKTQKDKLSTGATPVFKLDKNWDIFSNLISCYDYQCSGMGIENTKTMRLLNRLNNELQKQLKQAKIEAKEKPWTI